MATTTSRVREVLTTLHTLVVARANLTGVTVFQRTPSPRAVEGKREWITLATRIDGAQEFPAATKNLKYDRFTLYGEIWRSDPGAGEEIADDAHERTEALLAEVETVLQSNPALGLTNVEAQLTNYAHTFSGDDANRWQQTTFSVEVRVRMVSS